MMSYWQRLWRVELIGLGALLMTAIVIAVIFVFDALFVTPSDHGVSDVALLSFLLTIVYGLLPVVLFGAPVYTTLITTGRFRYATLFVVAALPGCLFLFVKFGFGIVAIIAGIAIISPSSVVNSAVEIPSASSDGGGEVFELAIFSKLLIMP